MSDGMGDAPAGSEVANEAGSEAGSEADKRNRKECKVRMEARRRAQLEYPGCAVKIDAAGAVMVRPPERADWVIVDIAPGRGSKTKLLEAVREWVRATMYGCHRVQCTRDGQVIAIGEHIPGRSQFVGSLDDVAARMKADPWPDVVNPVLALQRHHGELMVDFKRDGTVWVMRRTDAHWEPHGTLTEAYARIAPKTGGEA